MNRIEFAKRHTKLSYRNLCGGLGVPYHRFRRWKRRKESGEPLLRPPGPGKTEPFDTAVLRGELMALRHATYRTHGTERLYRKYQCSLSRREISWMVGEVRAELNGSYRRNLLRVEWLVPGVVWAVDGTEYIREPEKRELTTTRDLCSKYLLRPMATESEPCNEEVDGYIVDRFQKDKLPLILKMDNGGNLIGNIVIETLGEYRVIPLLSPPDYPRYNGSLENAQGDIKEAIRLTLPTDRKVTLDEFEVHARLAAHDLNHKAREVLKGKNPCQVYHDETLRKTFTELERKAIYDWINETQERILTEAENDSVKTVAAARRQAIEMWLLKNNIIRLTLNGKSVTLFSD